MEDDQRGLGGGFGWFIAAICAALLAFVLVTALSSCESADNAAARRADAEAARERARAAAYAERAAIREDARNSSHERIMESYPLIMLTGGAMLAFILILLVVWLSFDLRRTAIERRQPEALIWHLERLRLEQQARDRELWAAIASLDRRELPSGDSRRIITHDERGR